MSTIEQQAPPRMATCTPRRLTRVALVGPDGVGKSTVVEILREWFERDFPGHEFHMRQWRPNLLPDLGRFIGKPPSTGKKVPPRRKPGRFHVVRLLYYFWDFVLGGWWKDRLRTKPGALVIYDRCALDMQVDPVRFALQSAFGTRLFCRLTPQPDVVILLEDDPERIWERKREIARDEMREQLDCWRRLAAEGNVDAIVRVDACPEAIAARVWQLIVDILYNEPARSELAHELKATPDTGFAVLPHRANPRFLVPLAPRIAAANALAIYNPQTCRGRVWRGCVSLALRAGIAERFLEQVAFPSLELQSYLSTTARCDGAVISVSLGTPGVHQKSVYQIMDTRGRIRAFAKVGHNDLTSRLVEHEAAALRILGCKNFSTAEVPALLDSRWLDGNYVAVMGARDSKTGPVRLDQRHLEFLAALYRVRKGSTDGRADHRFLWSAEGGRGASGPTSALPAGFEYYAHVIECAMAHIGDISPMPAGFGHGDFSPWNIRTAGSKLLVIDWEYWDNPTPAGWDLFNFIIASGIELKKQSGAELFSTFTGDTREREAVERYFRLIGVSNRWINPLLIAWLAHTLSSNIHRFGASPSAIDKAARRAWAAMLVLMLRHRGAAL